jgi:predicted transcriptional regulator of viral defense system
MLENDSVRLLALAKRRGVITAREAAEAGIHSQNLTRLVEAGVLERIARGQYLLPDQSVSEYHSFVVVARAVPRGVICLLSALVFHRVGTQLPFEVWIAVERHARKPVLQHPPLRVVHFSGASFSEGIETHQLEGEPVRVYSVAKTVADLFKHRNKVGLDVAIEALKEGWRYRQFTLEDLDRAAQACRVARVMKPYVEAVVA